MNLYDCAVSYVVLPEAVLKLSSKISLIAALEVYRLGSLSALEGCGLTAYQRRKAGEISRHLLLNDVIEKTDTGVRLASLDMDADRSLAKERLVIPAEIDIQSLSFVSLKVLLTCYSLTRYSRTPFRLELTQAEIAKRAGITEKSARSAFAQLRKRGFIKTKKLWRTATQITLLEPASGVELYYIGEFYRQRMDRVPVFDRFKVILQDFDPKGKLKDIRSPVNKYTTHCPFCTKKDSTPRFVFDVDQDHWQCFNCRRSGTSARLWARFDSWIGRQDWKMLIGEVCGIEPSMNALTADGNEENKHGNSTACE